MGIIYSSLNPNPRLLISRCDQYPVSGGAYGDIYKCVYHGPGGDEEVSASINSQLFHVW